MLKVPAACFQLTVRISSFSPDFQQCQILASKWCYKDLLQLQIWPVQPKTELATASAAPLRNQRDEAGCAHFKPH